MVRLLDVVTLPAPAALAGVALSWLLALPCTAGAQGLDVEKISVAVELRVQLRDSFMGRARADDTGAWSARYVERGEWTLERARDGSYRLDADHSVRDLTARAAPVMTDGCGHEWVREWEDPARVEWESQVSAEAVLGGEVVAVWYAPVRPSLIDPGGRRGKGDCYDPDEEDAASRTALIFDPSGLRGRMDTESGLPAVRDDGRILLALIDWADLASGERIDRRVRYSDEGVRFRGRLELGPPF